jgi:hypothetical protein
MNASLRTDSQLAAWPTPNALPESRGGLQSNPEAALKRREQGHMLNLDDAATLASWATPKVKTGAYCYSQGDHDKPVLNLEGQAQLTAFGQTPNGSHAGTERRGQLNPALSRWLMGLPPAWDDCAVTATQSLPRRRKRS